MTDGNPQAVDDPLDGLSQQRLELGEGIFFGAEVGLAGREKIIAPKHR
jgi:hypothetical protein